MASDYSCGNAWLVLDAPPCCPYRYGAEACASQQQLTFAGGMHAAMLMGRAKSIGPRSTHKSIYLYIHVYIYIYMLASWLDCAGLDWDGLDRAGPDWAELGWAGLGRLGWTSLAGSDWDYKVEILLQRNTSFS